MNKLHGRPHPVILTIAALFLLVSASSGQEPPDRPRIGLCLAGGGARGGAHIGVLQVLEDMRIPVDYVAGTSIGSIIGGLYASGMSPAEMDSVLSGLDWAALFDDSPPRQLINFRRKSEDHLPYFGFEVGVGRDGLKLPAGFVAGPKLLFLLRSFTLPSVGIEDFDDLPIPYRAVACDLADGSLVVIDHGTIADAMRASMAIPGAFTPHVIDDRILVDGGFLRNVPYDVVKEMGADIVIVVDVGPTFTGLDADPSLMGVIDHAVTMSIVSNARVSLAELGDRDLLLTPELEGIGVESFDRMGETVAKGVTVAMAHLEELGRLSVSEDEFSAWQTRVRAGYAEPRITVGEVRVEARGSTDPARIRTRVQTRPGDPLDLQLLSEDLSRIARLGEFEVVDYALEPRGDEGTCDLVVRTRDKRWGPNYLRFGAAMEGHADGRSSFTILLYHRLAAINRLGAEWRNQVALGDRFGLDTEFYQPLTMNGRFFVAPQALGSLTKRQRWLGQDFPELVKSSRIQGSLDLGLNMSHWGELRLGAYVGDFWGEVEDAPDDLDDSLGGWRGRLVFDQVDNVDFPRRGWTGLLDCRLARSDLGAGTEYDRLHAQLGGAVSAGRTTFSARLEGGTSFGTTLPFHDRFELGGFTRLSGLERGRIFGDDAAMLSAGMRLRIASFNPAMGGHLYLALNGEAGQAWNHDDVVSLGDVLYGGNAYLGAETLLGPFYLGYGLTEGGHDSFYAMLGRIF